MIDLFLKNAHMVTEDGILEGGVAVEGGKIAAVVPAGQAVEARQEIDLQSQTLLPGLVDGHVHFNEPGRAEWEGYRTGSMAAAAGGVTTVLEMPLNATPPTINEQLLQEKRSLAAPQSVVDYANWGGLVNNNLADLEAMNEEGVIGFKAFASNSGVDFERIDDDLIYAGLQRMARFGNLIGLHAENEYVTTYLGQQIRAAGRTDRAGWPESRPPETELEAIRRACYWAKVTGGNLHIVHISIAEGVREVAKWKEDGAHVTAETCPHYLFFDQQDFERIGPEAKCAPPLRRRENVEQLWECVRQGLVDTIGSDHSPCTEEGKLRGMDNIWQAWGGITGIQTMLPALISEGVHRRGIELTQLARLLCANPAKIFGLYPTKGAIRPGADADLVVVDLEREWTLRREMLLSKNKHSAYIGSRFKGQVMQTWVRGRLVYADGQITVQPGYGKLLLRQTPYAYQAQAGG
jgi:allantoinase